MLRLQGRLGARYTDATPDELDERIATAKAALGERLFILTDLDSSNGTFLNDAEERIAREELVDNDSVTFGKTKMKFKCL